MASGRMAPSNAKSGRNVDPTLRPDSRLAFQRELRQTHGTHGTQGIIFADDRQYPVGTLCTLLPALAPGRIPSGTLTLISLIRVPFGDSYSRPDSAGTLRGLLPSSPPCPFHYADAYFHSPSPSGFLVLPVYNLIYFDSGWSATPCWFS